MEKPVVHISLNPHPDDVLTDTELQDIAREYLEKLGFGNQPYLVFKHEDIDRHHLHISGKAGGSIRISQRPHPAELEQSTGCTGGTQEPS